MRSRADRTSYRGERFAALKDIFKLTQQELGGERLGVTQAFISRIIRLDRPIPSSLAEEAAAQFGLPLSFFSVDPVRERVLSQLSGRIPGPVWLRNGASSSFIAKRRGSGTRSLCSPVTVTCLFYRRFLKLRVTI